MVPYEINLMGGPLGDGESQGSDSYVDTMPLKRKVRPPLSCIHYTPLPIYLYICPTPYISYTLPSIPCPPPTLSAHLYAFNPYALALYPNACIY